MPDIHLDSLVRLRTAYISAILLIILWLSCKQVFVQIILAQEVSVRTVATSLHRQELRSQRLLRNTLLLLGPGTHTQPLTEIQTDISAWEASQKDDDTHPGWFTSDERTRLTGGRAAYQEMDSALHRLLLLNGQTWPNERTREQALYPSVLAIFTHEVLYLRALDAVFTAVNSEADSRVTFAQIMNALLFGAAILTLIAEYFLVMKPVLYPKKKPAPAKQKEEEKKKKEGVQE